MKLFWENRFISTNKTSLILIFLGIVFHSCATNHAQYGKNIAKKTSINTADTSKISHTFYLIGDAGNTYESKTQETLSLFHDRIKKSDENSTLLFLGDNIYPKGLPNNDDPSKRIVAEKKLTNQLKLSDGFNGRTVFIPGNHDWDSGIQGLERQAKFVTEYLKDKKSFLPRKSCAIDDVKINKNVTLITIDSQWFMEDWDNYPTMNNDCDIKNREDFFAELMSLLNKNHDKTVVVALHHPLMSNGATGGQFSLEKQIFPFENKIPLPVLGSLINLFRKTSGLSPADIQNKQYTIFIKRVKTLLQSQNNVIVVSGHDHNLQYIERDNIKQIISGAGSKSEAARAVFPEDFSYGGNGYSELSIYENGNSKISYYSTENNREKLIYEKIILEVKEKEIQNLAISFPETTTTSIYSKKQTKKSRFYKFIFGKHYRKYYGTSIEVKNATIDTLFGGLKPKRAGGGHQTKSSQIEDKNGKVYVLRSLKKSTSNFIQSVAFKNQFLATEFENTYAEDFLYDFYTTAHPYTPLAVGNLAEKIGISHPNSLLYYIPKHKALKKFNAFFGDELYFIEERSDDSQKDLKSFGKPNAILSTDDLLKNLHKDEKYSVDENSYIKARLFDMLIGDWDRHQDQWRWGEYKIGNKTTYKPIPRDRDQAFPKYDGVLLAILMTNPALRHMQTFKEEIKNVKWLNREPYPLDLALLKTATEKEWIAQAKYIQENLTDADIDNAFKSLPKEVQDETIESIKQKLKIRRNQLQKYALEYYSVLQKTIIIVGTSKKDKFVINHTGNQKLEIQVYRVKKEGDELLYTREYLASKTKNIWIYGLDDDDIFEVKGNEKSKTKILLIGGQNNDSYAIENGKNIKIYDFKSKKNTFVIDRKTKINLTDSYETNLYDFKKAKYNTFSKLPHLSYNPDDGIKLVLNSIYTVNNFNQNPYTQKHSFQTNYYFATNGYELNYKGSFPKIIGKWDLDLQAQITSPNFTINYFGTGNETVNNDDLFAMNYNRVRLRMLKFAPSLKKIGRYGSEINFLTTIEKITVEVTNNRFINIPGIVDNTVFQSQQFAGATLKYNFENYDNRSLPTLGIGFSIAGSWKMNLNDIKRNFSTLESQLNLNHRIDSNGKIVLATNLKAKIISNNNYEFYQGATLGGDFDLRGFRNERFLGNKSFYQSSDLRLNLGKIKRSLIPMSYGILGGFDYGRVWAMGEDSNKWHKSIGGGFWLNGLNVITAKITYFKSVEEQARIAFGLGFGF
ncbi:hypothetical protein H4V97_000905 [Flavobacterium sp. CG_23.5]|uniref:metallophosphoesterase n=1 Tax=Flavobacterium sp. CG_23.5 TaxID=2760708 RepID=UPI001AE67CC4|nr:metallophosphoesterase [Flavobacterium sp. CG_23.5]MBP2282587.1 hypothetical protein [Flavobacterium sp. CG_23.5]